MIGSTGMDKEALRQFLIDSNKAGYATGKERAWVKEPDGSTSIPFVKDMWRSHDNYFGGEPYGGRVVVFYEGKPVWMMRQPEGVAPKTER